MPSGIGRRSDLKQQPQRTYDYKRWHLSEKALTNDHCILQPETPGGVNSLYRDYWSMWLILNNYWRPYCSHTHTMRSFCLQETPYFCQLVVVRSWYMCKLGSNARMSVAIIPSMVFPLHLCCMLQASGGQWYLRTIDSPWSTVSVNAQYHCTFIHLCYLIVKYVDGDAAMYGLSEVPDKRYIVQR